MGVAQPFGVWRGARSASSAVGRYGWNTVELNGTVPDDELIELVDASYDDVVAQLPKSRRPPVG